MNLLIGQHQGKWFEACNWEMSLGRNNYFYLFVFYSRIGEIMNEIVNDYGVVWVASAGNHGKFQFFSILIETIKTFDSKVISNSKNYLIPQ